MNEVDQLISALWAPFVEKINAGKPVYFCFYHDLLEKLIPKHLLDKESPSHLIQSTVLDNSSIIHDRIYLKESSLTKRENGFSLAIVYACQQVLAVEDMSNDPCGVVSANAYFPRLRRAISPELQQISSNPFSFKEFEAIWKTLERETLEVRGGNSNSVTFRFDCENGINKARYFPFSQGLLSHEDLEIISSKIGLTKIRKLSKDKIYDLVAMHARSLSRRAQNLINTYYLRENICDQIMTFSKTSDVYMIDNTSALEIKYDEYNIIVFKDSDDWFSESFLLFIQSKVSGYKIFENDQLTRSIHRCKLRNGYILFPLSAQGDSWIKSDSPVDILPGDSFLLVGNAEDIIKAANEIWEIAGIDSNYNDEFVKYDFFGFKISELVLPIISTSGIVAKSGRLVGPSEVYTLSKHEWIGGICLDYRYNKYLKGHLPSGLLYRNNRFNMSDVISINGHFISFFSFEESIQDARRDIVAELIFPHSVKARLIVGVARSEEKKIGLKVRGNGKLDLAESFIAEDQHSFIIGFYPNTASVTAGCPPRVIASVLFSLSAPDCEGVNLTENEVRLIKNRIHASQAPKDVQQVACELLSRNPKLPLDVLHQLLVS